MIYVLSIAPTGNQHLGFRLRGPCSTAMGSHASSTADSAVAAKRKVTFRGSWDLVTIRL